MRIQHNIKALNANRNLTWNNNAVGKSLEKLSSGYRINRAADDAAGLAISEKMRAQISCLSQAETNCSDGISLIQTAEGALNEVHSILDRMVELAEQSANGTYDDEVDRKNLQAEVEQLQLEIDRISEATNFNGINLLDGSLGATTGNPLQMVGIGTALDDAIVTKAAGASLVDGTKVELSQNDKAKDENGVDITTDFLVTTTNTKTGEAVAVSIDLLDAMTITNGENAGKTLRDAGVIGLKQGETASIDLTSAGLGIVEITANADLAAADLVEPLIDNIEGEFTDPTNNDGSGLTLQIGDTGESHNKLVVSIDSMSTTALGVSDVNVASQDGASNAIDDIKDAINKVSSTRGTLGAMQNRLEHTMNNLSVTNENVTNAESRIRDVDMAKEMMTYTSKNILSQAAQSMLAQANQAPQQVLSLLQ